VGFGISPDNNYRLNIASAGKAGSIKLDGSTEAVIDNGRNRAVTGSAGGPSYAFLSDEYTGMFSGGVGAISFSCGANTRFGITTTGATFTQNTSVTTTSDPALKLENASASVERLLFCTKLNAGNYNSITTVGDAGLIYGTIPAAQGFVLAPHRTGSSGIRLDSNGNVGIGASPDSAFVFDVTGKSRIRNELYVGPDTTNGFIRMTVAGGISYIQSSSNEGSSYNKLYFSGYGGNNNTMTLDIPNQRVGIGGQTGPTEKLDVTGNIKASGTITASGLITANGGLTVPSGQATNTAAITASGLITANAGLTVASGQTLTANGPITGANGLTITSGTTSLQATTITGNLSVTGTITGTSKLTFGVYSV
jgi:hypothetical protein